MTFILPLIYRKKYEFKNNGKTAKREFSRCVNGSVGDLIEIFAHLPEKRLNSLSLDNFFLTSCSYYVYVVYIIAIHLFFQFDLDSLQALYF